MTVRFPLGVYHGQSAQSADEPEWPPSPLRLIGALLAAAHACPASDPEPARRLIQQLTEQPAPVIVAPEAVSVGEQTDRCEPVRLRGATRWAPRNYVSNSDGVSPRSLGRERAAVSKVGVALGDRPIHFVWPDLSLPAAQLARLRVLAQDVTFLGTTRSPAVVEIGDEAVDATADAWTPAGPDQLSPTVGVRVPDPATIAAFDWRHAARRSTNGRVQPGGIVPQLSIGREIGYVHGDRVDALDPAWWGDIIVLAVDTAQSEIVPKADGGYVFARAVRTALLGAFGDQGTPEEAPPILVGRNADPHCAIVPLPHVSGPEPSGRIVGVAVVLPHASRVPDLGAQRARLERGLRELIDGDRRYVRPPGAGRIWLELPDLRRARLTTLQPARYVRPAATWASVTPVVHSRWRKRGEDALREQVAADCRHVGLPEPVRVELLRGPARRGGVWLGVPHNRVPEAWRSSISGQADHVRITFARPVRGPVLLGRSRHFGGGLCLPEAAVA